MVAQVAEALIFLQKVFYPHQWCNKNISVCLFVCLFFRHFSKITEERVSKVESIIRLGGLVSGRTQDPSGHSVLWNAIAFERPEAKGDERNFFTVLFTLEKPFDLHGELAKYSAGLDLQTNTELGLATKNVLCSDKHSRLQTSCAASQVRGIIMHSTLAAMASNLLAMASYLIAMASNLIAVASNQQDAFYRIT